MQSDIHIVLIITVEGEGIEQANVYKSETTKI